MAADARSEVGIDVGLGTQPAPTKPRVDSPFCLLVLGDFGGGADVRGPLRDRRPMPFDRDDVDAAVARVHPRIVLSPGGARPFTLGFASIDDFHPDRLYVGVPLFASLRELRTRLSDPRTFAAAARDLAADSPDVSSEPLPADEGKTAGSLLDRMVDAVERPAPRTASGRQATASPATDDLTDFIRQVVRPHLVAGPDPRQPELVAGVDAALAAEMRGVLRDPAFQALESAWRTVERLARRIETGTELRLCLLDMADAELDAELEAAAGGDGLLRDHLARTAAELPGDGHWSAVVVLRRFGGSDGDDSRLARLAAIGRSLGTPVLADAHPALAGLPSWASLPDPREWAAPDRPQLAALRTSPAAAWLCLAAPRVLLRVPYGEDGEPLDSFDFEEAADAPAHDAYLWGSGAAVCALLLARAFSARGWAMRPGEVAELDGVPMHLLRLDGESTILPGAETLLTERAAERLMELGITPIATVREQDTVRVVRFQSFASLPTALAGPWTTGT